MGESVKHYHRSNFTNGIKVYEEKRNKKWTHEQTREKENGTYVCNPL